jgi:hypothetical protein
MPTMSRVPSLTWPLAALVASGCTAPPEGLGPKAQPPSQSSQAAARQGLPAAGSSSRAGHRPGAAATRDGASASLFVAPAPAPSPHALVSLPDGEATLLTAWYAAVSPRKPGESFGALVARAGLAELGKPYYDPPTPPGPETLVIRLEDFQCVSLVESSVALARCIALEHADEACFVHEMEASRYRGGVADGFASKLHYFSEWISDNAKRGRLRDVTAALGGVPLAYTFDFMTRHRWRYPPLEDAAVLAQLQAVESRLSGSPTMVVTKEGVAKAERALQTGDILGMTGTMPGILVTHAALVVRGLDGVTRLLHASSYHGRVILGQGDIVDYVRRRPERLGFIAARPLPPAPLRALSTVAR